MVDTSVNIGSLQLKNPVMVASGTFGYGNECLDLVDVSKLGAVITKSLTLKPRDGNPPMRIVETTGGMLNSIGLANVGIQKFILEKLPELKRLNTTMIVNIAGSTIEEYEELLKILEEHDGIAGYEINVSCPNVKEGGLAFGTRCDTTSEITRRVRTLTKKTLIVKLTPNVTRISEFAQAVEAEGADAVSVMNTLVGIAVDVKSQKPKLSTITGGLSGPAIKPVALAKVYEVYKNVKIPIIGLGGIMNWSDAVEFMLVGATAIQVGTANFIDPSVGIKIADGIQKYCEERRISRVIDLKGAMKL
ncbi:MAG: dihydroorotate dehydrogenase [Ignavibacteriales bacterium]|nr:dihydroorotate dehydrogenase [Ignavibacteriales bacterium]